MRDRVDKATPGPWTAEDANPHKPHKRFAFYIPEIMSAPSMPQYDGLTTEDAEFIVHARTDVPRLIELVGEMAEALESVVCVFDAMNDVELSLHVGMEAARAQRAARQVLAKYRGEEDKP